MSASSLRAIAGEDQPGYAGWRVALGAAVGVFVSFASLLVYTFGIFLKPLSEEFGWSREAVSAAFGIAALTVAVCSPPLGRLLDRYGPRRIIVPCLVVFGCAFASLGLLTRHLWHLYAVFVVLGVVGNGTAQMAYSRAVSTWFRQRRGMALAIVMTGGATGAIVLPPAAQTLIQALGWRGAFFVLGALVLVLGVPFTASLVRERKREDNRPHSEASGASVAEGLRSRPFWILIAVLFLASVSQNAAITHLSALLTDRGIPAGRAALALSALGAASVVGRLVTGWLLDRFFGPAVAAVLLAISAAGVFLLAGATTLGAGILAAVLIGVGMGGEADVTPYLLSRYFGLRSFSTLYGFSWTAYAIAGAAGPVFLGRAFDTTASYGPVLTMLAALTLVAAGLMFAMPPYVAEPAAPDASTLSTA